MIEIRPDDAIAELHRSLEATIGALAAEVERNGSPSKLVDEILSRGSLALERAVACGVISHGGGRISSEGSFLPIDDDRLPLSDGLLDADVVQAGIEQLERVDRDMANYVAGETIDWDHGMTAVAVYRAMTRQGRLSTYRTRLDVDARADIVEVQAVSPEDAAGVRAMNLFHASEGEWMGGVITVALDATDADAMDARGVRIDCAIEFDAARDGETYAATRPLPPVTVKTDPEVRRILDAAARLLPPRSERELAARRFRALMAIGGASMAGSAGFDPSTGARRNPDTPGCVHVGMEVATAGSLSGNVRWAANAFRALAEDRIVMDYGKVPEHEVGVSEDDDAARWDALMRLPRIKVWHHAGDRDGDRTPRMVDGAFSFFAEYWVYGEEKPGAEDDPRLGRECLAIVADAIIAAHRA
jgi:hypothetical protein